MNTQLIKTLHSGSSIKVQRAVAITRLVVGLFFSFTLLLEPAAAQSLKQTGVSIFNAIYAIVGVVGAIACLLTLLNWITGNWLGREDPRKLFFQCLLGTALAFAVVAIIQFIKDTVGADASGISNL